MADGFVTETGDIQLTDTAVVVVAADTAGADVTVVGRYNEG